MQGLRPQLADTFMSDQTAILIVVALASVFFALWVYSGKQKRKFDEEKRQRKLEFGRIKAKARDESEKE